MDSMIKLALLLMALSPICGLAVSHSGSHSSGHSSHHSTHPSHSIPHLTPHVEPHVVPHPSYRAPQIWHPTPRGPSYHPFPSTNHILLYWFFFRPHVSHPTGGHVVGNEVDMTNVVCLFVGMACVLAIIVLACWTVPHL